MTLRVDLHVHTDRSIDGRHSLERMATAAKQAGLDAMAICDHDLCTPVPEALEGVLLIPACEVSTRAGHITGLFLDRPLDLEALGRLPAPEAAVAAIARAAFKVPDANARAAAFAAARSLPPVGGSHAHDAREVGNAYTELTAEALTVPALRAALAAGRSRAVLERNTAHVRKGLSQWTKALRRGGVLRLGKAAAYVCWCAWLDVTDRR